MTTPTMEAVKSGNIEAVGYDPAKSELHVQFKGGGHYVYDGVTAASHRSMLAADSIGGFLSSKIKGQHKFRKL